MSKLTDAIANLTLVNKVFLIVAMLGTLALIITFYSVQRLSDVDAAYRGLLTNDVDAAILMSEAQADLHEASRTVYAVLTEQKAATMRAAQHQLDALQRDLVSKIQRALILMPHEKVRLQTILHSQAEAFRVGADVIEAAARWRGDRALGIIYDELDPQLERLGEVLNAVQSDTVNNYLTLSSKLGEQTQQTILATAIALFLALLLVIGLAALLSIRVISRPIMTLAKVMRNFSNHHYREPIPYTDRHDEVGQMAKALQVFREDLQRNEELERINRENETARILAERTAQAKSIFLATMSHEIRTPLNAVIVLARLSLKQESNPVQHHRLQRIVNASEHLLHIISDILDFSKLDAGQMLIEPTDFDANDILQTVSNMLSEAAEQKGLTLKLHGIPTATGWIRADAFRINQILINYVSNAVKFSDKGSIAIRLSLQPKDDNKAVLRAEVKDQGIGMSRDQVQSLFQPFHQADASISRRYGGTGLGLAICRSLAELMQGQVGAHSQPGRGSTFWFEIPVQLIEAPAQATNHAAVQPSANKPLSRRAESLRLLLVDDNALNREVGKELLELLGAQVELVSNGTQAIEQLKAHPAHYYSAVLMDLMMPQMDGLQTTRSIRKLPGLKTLPIIALSANASQQDIAECHAAGCTAHVAKPIDENQLWDTLLSCTGSDQPQLPCPLPSYASASTTNTSSLLSQLTSQNIDSTVFNPAMLQSLASTMRHANLDRLIELARAEMDELGQILQRPDLLQQPDILSQLAHDLISTCGHIGLKQTAQATQQLRQAIASASPTSISVALIQVKTTFELARQAFDLWAQNHHVSQTSDCSP